MRVLLVYPPSLVRWNLLPPLGIAAVAAALRKAGIETEQLNLELRFVRALRQAHDEQVRRSLCAGALQHNASPDQVGRFHELLNEVMPSPAGFDVLGLSLVGEAQATSAVRIARWFLQQVPSGRLMIGGPFAIANASRLRFLIDRAGIEAELFSHADAGSSVVAWLRTFEKSAPGASAPELKCGSGHGGEDAMDYLFEHCFEPQAACARMVYGLVPSGPMLQFPVSMGCVARCGFCTRRNLGLRRGHPEETAWRISNLASNYASRSFKFECDSLNFDSEWLDAFCDALSRSTGQLMWNAYARPCRLDYRQLSRLRQAGCGMLRFGVESGSDKVLLRLRKGILVSEVEAVLNASRRAGIWNSVLFMVGTPGETEADVTATVTFIERNAHLIDSAIVNVFELLTGTSMSARPEQFGIAPRSPLYGRLPFDDVGACRSWEEHLEFAELAHDRICRTLIDCGIGLTGTSPDLLQLALLELGNHERVKAFLRRRHPYFFNPLPHHVQRWLLYNAGIDFPAGEFLSAGFASRFGYHGIERIDVRECTTDA